MEDKYIKELHKELSADSNKRITADRAKPPAKRVKVKQRDPEVLIISLAWRKETESLISLYLHKCGTFLCLSSEGEAGLNFSVDETDQIECKRCEHGVPFNLITGSWTAKRLKGLI